MTIVITRPKDDTEQLAKALIEKGYNVFKEPLLKVETLPYQKIEENNWQAVIGTSANCFKSLANHPDLNSLLALPVFCIGPSSADVARKIGFRRVEISGGSLEELNELIIKKLTPKNGPLLYLSGKIISGELNPAGFETCRKTIYQAVALERLSHDLIQQIKSNKIEGVLLYSPRTAKIWLNLLSESELLIPMENILHYCLSLNVANQLPSNWSKIIALKPEETEMLCLIPNRS